MASGAPPEPEPPLLLCDGSLGALARWLRAAGHAAQWRAGTGGDALVDEARRSGAVLLTSDHRVLERRAVQRGAPRALLVPSSLTRFEQLAFVLRSLGLRLRAPRCMGCGGELEAVEKESVRDRIPPRTAAWKDEYFVCRGCGRLFWRGTHWDRIRARLQAAATV